MSHIFFFVLLAIVIFCFTFWMGRRFFGSDSSLQKSKQAMEDKKKSAHLEILTLFEKQEKVMNNDVQKLLTVSDATATRYLEELQKEGKIIQQGITGKWVFYTKV